MQKIERLMGIVLALNKNKKMTANQLARKFEVDIRTIYRVVWVEHTYRIWGGPEGGYSVLNEYFIPPIMLNKDELFSLLLSKKAFEELSSGRTTIAIAHRLSTIKNADEIIVLTDMGIMERGKHEELTSGNGLYANLYKSQFKQDVSDNIA